jgi:hypothetical protein
MGPRMKKGRSAHHHVGQRVKPLPSTFVFFSRLDMPPHRSVDIKLVVTCSLDETRSAPCGRSSLADETGLPSPSNTHSSSNPSYTILSTSSSSPPGTRARESVKSIKVTCTPEEWGARGEVGRVVLLVVDVDDLDFRGGVEREREASAEGREVGVGWTRTLPQCRSRCCSERLGEEVQLLAFLASSKNSAPQTRASPPPRRKSSPPARAHSSLRSNSSACSLRDLIPHERGRRWRRLGRRAARLRRERGERIAPRARRAQGKRTGTDLVV